MARLVSHKVTTYGASQAVEVTVQLTARERGRFSMVRVHQLLGEATCWSEYGPKTGRGTFGLWLDRRPYRLTEPEAIARMLVRTLSRNLR